MRTMRALEYIGTRLRRDLIDQSHVNWITAYESMEEEWGMQALCCEGGCMWMPILDGQILDAK